MPDTSTPNPSEDGREEDRPRPRLTLRRKGESLAAEDEKSKAQDTDGSSQPTAFESEPSSPKPKLKLGGGRADDRDRAGKEENGIPTASEPPAPPSPDAISEDAAVSSDPDSPSKPKFGLKLKSEEAQDERREAGAKESFGAPEDGVSENRASEPESSSQTPLSDTPASEKPKLDLPSSIFDLPPDTDLIDPPVSTDESERPREISPTEKALRGTGEKSAKKPGLRLKKDEGERREAEGANHLPSSGEASSPDSGSIDEPLDLSTLPFTLPDRIGDEPPPLPIFNSVIGASGTPPRQVEKPKPSVTFDDLEPAHSDKAPPPIDAPVHKGKVRKHRSQIGRIMVIMIPLALIVLGGIYTMALLQEDPAPPVETLPPPSTTVTADPDSAVTAADVGSEVEEALTPIVRADPEPLVAVIVDELEVNLARRNSTPQIVILNGVSFTPGDVVNPEVGLTFIGFHEDPNIHEIVFEDARGARYYRGY